MRIIAGQFRARRLVPPGPATRPITDRAKQSLFDILAPRLDGARVYDCFAGTGSMGLECLSRGAARATFFESDAAALSGLKANINTLGLHDRTRIVSGDLFRWFASPPASAKSTADLPLEPAQGLVDLIFLDPPYRYVTEKTGELQCLASAFTANHLSPGGLVIFRRDRSDEIKFPSLKLLDAREYGAMRIELLGP